MLFDYLCDVFYTTVTNFQVFSVKDFAQPVGGGEMLVDQT